MKKSAKKEQVLRTKVKKSGKIGKKAQKKFEKTHRFFQFGHCCLIERVRGNLGVLDSVFFIKL
ncbi:MAG: hypothetical protein ACYS9Y_10180 [Planctomycetota bacterium]